MKLVTGKESTNLSDAGTTMPVTGECIMATVDSLLVLLGMTSVVRAR